jgi:hypothetical protein
MAVYWIIETDWSGAKTFKRIAVAQSLKIARDYVKRLINDKIYKKGDLLVLHVIGGKW